MADFCAFQTQSHPAGVLKGHVLYRLSYGHAGPGAGSDGAG